MAVLQGGACAHSPSLSELNNELVKVRSEYAEQRELLSLYTCRIEFRAMYQAIREECAATAKKFGRVSRACPPEVVAETVSSLQTRLGVQLSDLVREFLHTVAYVGALHEEGTLQARSNKASTLHKNREDVLDFALAPPWPVSMRILLITPPSPKDKPELVKRRLDWVQTYLERRGLPKSSLEPPLIYDLGVSTDAMRPIEKAVPPEIDDPSTAVWIIRLDCPTALTQTPQAQR